MIVAGRVGSERRVEVAPFFGDVHQKPLLGGNLYIHVRGLRRV